MSTFSVNADEVDQISRIYHKQCATCHGDNGDGKGRAGASLIPMPTNFTASENKSRLNIENIKLAIRDGIKGTAMSAYGRRFDDGTIAGLAIYISDQFINPKQKQSLQTNEQGKTLYAKHCSACHGDNGNTAVWAKNALNPAPRNFTSEVSKAELSLERMITSVTYGRPGTAMMSFEKRLSTEEIQSVVLFIRNNFMQINQRSVENNPRKESTPSLVDMSLSFPNQLVGDAAAGKLFFNKNCITCHGKKGDGKGPRAHFNFPRPKNFTSLEARQELNRPRIFKSISKGRPRTVMSAWSSVLNEQQIADVGEYVFQSFIIEKSQKKKP